MRRIRFGGSEIAHLGLEHPAAWIKFFMDDGGRPSTIGRAYTVRRFDRPAGEIDMDFVIHGEGPLSLWAQPAEVLLADKGYDSAELRRQVKDRGGKAIIPNRSNRKKKFRFDRRQYRERHKIENAFCRLKDFRRIVRYDKLAFVFAASIHLAATIAWWI